MTDDQTTRDEELEWWQAEAAHWRAMAVKAREGLRRVEQVAMYEWSNAGTLAPEPPVGSTLVPLDPHQQQWSRRDDGWHCSDPDCVSCPLTWSLVIEIGGADEMRRELPSGRVSR